jgi:hypothetical protein
MLRNSRKYTGARKGTFLERLGTMIYKVGQKAPPESTPLEIKPVLVFVPQFYKNWVIGWFYGGNLNEWRVQGGNGNAPVTHWTYLPKTPNIVFGR